MIIGGTAIALSIAVLVFVVPLLRRTTALGHTPRLAVFAWLSLSLTVLVSLALAGVAALSMSHVEPMPNPAHGVLVDLTGSHTAAELLRHGVGLLLITPLVRFGYSLTAVLVRARRDRDLRRGALRVLGHRPAGERDVALIESEVPMVYCMPGRPRIVLVTTAARDRLEAEQLAAVLEHERTHLAERHHLLVAVARAIGLTGRRVWLFRSTERFVRDLVEMRADDVAAHRFGAQTVVTAMRKLSTVAPPVPALGASGPSLLTRIHRMDNPATTAQRVLAGVGSCWVAGAGCVLLFSMVVVPVVAILAGGGCLYMS